MRTLLTALPVALLAAAPAAGAQRLLDRVRPGVSRAARARLGFSGSLATWGAGFADANVSIGDYLFDPNYTSADYSPADATEKARTRAFKGSLIYWLHGGDSADVYLNVLASVNRDATYGTGAPGTATAYLDPQPTIGSVPEPAAWTMMVAGFALVGAVARRRTAAIAA